MAYECFHGNNDSLSWLDGPTYGHAAEGKESSGDHIWLWGDFYFISAQQEESVVWNDFYHVGETKTKGLHVKVMYKSKGG